MKLFLQKNAKFLSAGGYALTPPCLWRLGALPPNPSLRRLGVRRRRLGASPPDPKTPPPPLRISGYAPDSLWCKIVKKILYKSCFLELERIKIICINLWEKLFRISNKSLFEQPSGTDYFRKPRFDCILKTARHRKFKFGKNVVWFFPTFWSRVKNLT